MTPSKRLITNISQLSFIAQIYAALQNCLSQMSKGKERVKDKEYGDRDPHLVLCPYFLWGGGQESVKFRGSGPVKQ